MVVSGDSPVTKKETPLAKEGDLQLQYQNGPIPDVAESFYPSREVNVGKNLRQVREQRHFSVRALAEKSGLAVNTLSLIENGKSSPSVSTLQQLAAALDIPIAAFFETEDRKSNVTIIKANHRRRAAFENGILEDLGAGSVIQAVEPFCVTLLPQAGSGEHEIVHTGYEFFYCLEGLVQYTIDIRSFLLEPGDSLLFEAHLPHCWNNPGPVEARFILIMIPSDMRDDPIQRHFFRRSP
jgi:transcriptional regulator with XRE-family HTH domain